LSVQAPKVHIQIASDKFVELTLVYVYFLLVLTASDVQFPKILCKVTLFLLDYKGTM